MLTQVLDLLHGIIVFIPILIFFLPKKIFFHKYLLLFIVLLPHHWVYFDNHCVLSIIIKKGV